jgi:hypothetical protein
MTSLLNVWYHNLAGGGGGGGRPHSDAQALWVRRSTSSVGNTWCGLISRRSIRSISMPAAQPRHVHQWIAHRGELERRPAAMSMSSNPTTARSSGMAIPRSIARLSTPIAMKSLAQKNRGGWLAGVEHCLQTSLPLASSYSRLTRSVRGSAMPASSSAARKPASRSARRAGVGGVRRWHRSGCDRGLSGVSPAARAPPKLSAVTLGTSTKPPTSIQEHERKVPSRQLIR